jgi:hypothetical protein
MRETQRWVRAIGCSYPDPVPVLRLNIINELISIRRKLPPSITYKIFSIYPLYTHCIHLRADAKFVQKLQVLKVNDPTQGWNAHSRVPYCLTTYNSKRKHLFAGFQIWAKF